MTTCLVDQNLLCSEEPSSSEQLGVSFEQAFTNIGPEHPFIDFDIGFSAEQKYWLNQLVVTTTKSFEEGRDNLNNFANFETTYTEFLREIGNTEEVANKVTLIISNWMQSNLQATADPTNESTLIFSAAALANNNPLVWHIDNSNTTYDHIELRIATTLLGSKTLFCQLAENKQTWKAEIDHANHLSDIFEQVSNKIFAKLDNPNSSEHENNPLIIKEFNELYAERIKDEKSVCSEEVGHAIHQLTLPHAATLFVGGKTDFSAIHTAPITDKPRLFFSFTAKKPYN